jgi:O-Antigen ligase
MPSKACPRDETRGTAAGRRTDALVRAQGWLERALGFCVLLLPPLLSLAPRGAAPLAAFAGLCAASLIVLGPMPRLAQLRQPAALLGALLVWGALSAAWSLDPGRSLVMVARLAGLFAAGLALAIAAGRIAAPGRIAVLALAGTGIGIALALLDLASGGGLSGYVSIRPFAAPRLNQIAVWLAVLSLPAAALLLCRGRRPLALAVAAAMTGAVFLLDDTTAKLALALSVPLAGLLYAAPRRVARLLALMSMLAILSAPLTLPRLARTPGVFASADAFKISLGHRLLIWSFAGDRIAERPFVGWGLDSSRAIPGGKDEIRPGENWLPLHPHDAALQVWLELGAPGAALFALLVGWLWLRLAEAPWPRPYGAAAGASLAAALAVGAAGWGVWQEWWIGTLSLALFVAIAMARAATPPGAATPPRQRDWRGAGR